MSKPSSRATARLLLVGLAFALGACATAYNPVTGRTELTTMSPQRESQLGRQASLEVEREIGLVRAKKLTAYVDGIGQRLATASPRRDVPYQFAVANMAEANAFALPGGYIYVSRGLLALANSEDELANVLAHEIGHVAARHAAQRDTRATGVGVLSALGTIAAAALGGAEAAQMVGQLGQVAGAGLIASYSREQERQADEIGQKIAAQSGWDPAAMASFLATLDREGQAHAKGVTRRPSFLDSHPAAGERARAAQQRAAELQRSGFADRDAGQGPIAATRADFLRRLEGLQLGPDPREGVFRDEHFLHPILGFAIDFPRGWQTRNVRRAVGAQSPRRDAVVVLESQGPREEPRTAARRWFAAHGAVQLVESGAVRIGGWPAYRAVGEARTQQGVTALMLTWIAHPKGTFLLTGMTSVSAWRSHAGTFERVASSLRPLSAAERNSITDLRLRVVEARAGETLAALGRRTNNRWSLDETALANAWPRDARLERGRLVKIAIAVPLDERA
jgi:predicted Zn-dependent protease